MTNCIDCDTVLIGAEEMFVCDPCRMERVVDKLFTNIVNVSGIE